MQVLGKGELHQKSVDAGLGTCAGAKTVGTCREISRSETVKLCLFVGERDIPRGIFPHVYSGRDRAGNALPAIRLAKHVTATHYLGPMYFTSLTPCVLPASGNKRDPSRNTVMSINGRLFQTSPIGRRGREETDLCTRER